MSAASAGPVAAQLKASDPDRYFSTLILSPPAREAVQALYAFSADVASIRDRAREPTLGEMRLQWWVDALGAEGGGGARANPLADGLMSAIEGYRLPTAALLRLIGARRFDLYDDPMPDMPAFEGYAGETASVLYQLAAMILNGGAGVTNGDAAGHLGVAHALIGHLRAFGLNASRGRLFLPFSVFASNGVTEAEIFSGTPSEGLLAAHGELVAHARDHLGKAKSAIRDLPAALRPAFAMIALLTSQLDRLERQGETPFAPPRELSDWRKIATMVWWSLQAA